MTFETTDLFQMSYFAMASMRSKPKQKVGAAGTHHTSPRLCFILLFSPSAFVKTQHEEKLLILTEILGSKAELRVLLTFQNLAKAAGFKLSNITAV